MEVVDTKPRKLVTPPAIVWVEVAPRRSVASNVSEPLVKAPLTSEPTKNPPIADTPVLKFENVIASAAVLVDSQGFAAEPAPKKPSGAAAREVSEPAVRLSGDAVALVTDRSEKLSTPGAVTAARKLAWL